MQPLMQRNLAKSSLKRGRTPRTVLLQMAADLDRADRLKRIKRGRPALRWRELAEAVGVTERTVAEWAKTGAMSYTNAKKAALYLKVDLDWLWRGPEPQSPDLIAAFDADPRAKQLAKIEAAMEAQRVLLEAIAEKLGVGG